MKKMPESMEGKMQYILEQTGGGLSREDLEDLACRGGPAMVDDADTLSKALAKMEDKHDVVPKKQKGKVWYWLPIQLAAPEQSVPPSG